MEQVKKPQEFVSPFPGRVSITIPDEVQVERTPTNLVLLCRTQTTKTSFIVVPLGILLAISGFFTRILAPECIAAAILIGAWLIYYGLVMRVNRVQISVTSKKLCIKNIPFPWFGNRTLRSEQITRMLNEEEPKTKARRRRGKSGYPIHHLTAALRNGRMIQLIPCNLFRVTHFLKVEIEQFLDLSRD